MNRQNERLYRAVELKTEIPEHELVVEVDKQQPSIMAYASVSWHGKTELRFLEGFAEGQDNVVPSKRKKKTINQTVYRDEMCPLMFRDINDVMGAEEWIWQQDGAKPHTATATVNWLEENTPQFIRPSEWPSKSPDLNVMDYSIWGILLQHLQAVRSDITTVDELKNALLLAWQNIDMEVIRKATASWIPRLRNCCNNDGGHFEHL